MTGGILQRGDGRGQWAWFALRLRPAETIEDSRAYPDLPEDARRADLAAAERAWLGGLARSAGGVRGARWELRYTASARAQAVSCVLLGRVHGADAASVHTAALSLRDQLARTPQHVRAFPLTDDEQVQTELRPRALADAYEFRKRLASAPSSRPNARRTVVSISQLHGDGRSWEPIWAGLRRQPEPTTLALYLEPLEPPDGFAESLRALAAEYAALAAPRAPNPIWTVRSGQDPFESAAARQYAGFASRYSAPPLFRTRLSLVSAGPIDPAFAQLVADTMGATACRTAPSEFERALANLVSLNRDWLPETYGQGVPPEALGSLERILADLADLPEAEAVFRLPQEAVDQMPVFAPRRHPGGLMESPVAGPRDRKRVFVSYVREDLDQVQAVVDALHARGYDVWMDLTDIVPGQRWKKRIKDAIEQVDFFVACFSERAGKPQSYMNEELIAAVERLRLMPRDRSWFLPVKLDGCALPDHPIGPGESLRDLDYADFGRDWDEAFELLVKAIGPPAAQ